MKNQNKNNKDDYIPPGETDEKVREIRAKQYEDLLQKQKVKNISKESQIGKSYIFT